MALHDVSYWTAPNGETIAVPKKPRVELVSQRKSPSDMAMAALVLALLVCFAIVVYAILRTESSPVTTNGPPVSTQSDAMLAAVLTELAQPNILHVPTETPYPTARPTEPVTPTPDPALLYCRDRTANQSCIWPPEPTATEEARWCDENPEPLHWCTWKPNDPSTHGWVESK